MGEYPFAGPYVPAGVAVAKQRPGAIHAGEEKEDRDKEGEVSDGRQQPGKKAKSLRAPVSPPRYNSRVSHFARRRIDEATV